MASQSKIEELFEVAKSSLSFEGIKVEDIKEAVMDYKDYLDKQIDDAILKIKDKDKQIEVERNLKRKVLDENRDKNILLREKEKQIREVEIKEAELLLSKLFKDL